MNEAPKRPGALPGLLKLAWRQPLFALPFGLFFGLIYTNTWSGYVLAFEISLVFSYFIGVGLWVCDSFVAPLLLARADVRGLRGTVLISGAYVAHALVAAYAASAVVYLTIFPGFLGSFREFAITGIYTLLFSALFLGFNLARMFHRRALERGRAVETMRAELAQAELRALRAQVNPHFLFNTLNSIAALIPVNPAAAEETTTLLAEVFRYALQASGREHARLGDELAFVRSYLDIERVRLGDRLAVAEDVQPGLDSVPVPALLLQPLVENAVRHGVAPVPRGGTVRISARREGTNLRIEVADDGPGMTAEPAAAGTGFGLRSVRDRLAAMGPPHAIHVDSAPGRGTRVSLTLPCAPANPKNPDPNQGDCP